jgi:hypothetical protein
VVSGVGQADSGADCEDEEPFPAMRRPDFTRREYAFLDEVAKAFEVWPNNVPVSKPKVSLHVLEEAPSGSKSVKDGDDERPEVSRVLDAPPLSCVGEGLARVGTDDSLHSATPRLRVEGSEVRPDRSVVQGTVRNTRRQDAGASDFVLHVADCASVWQSSS